jgi:hypothetical protein
MGSGFIIEPTDAKRLGLGTRAGLEKCIREYRNGRDLTARPRGVMVIDLFGLNAEKVRVEFPEVHQHLLQTVKPERDKNNRAAYRNNWWIFGEPRRELRPAIAALSRYIATVETTKHRVFQFIDNSIVPDNMLVVVASDDAFHLGVLSSRPHVVWSLKSGGWLGVGNDPRYSKSRCFDPFPFPEASEKARKQIHALAEELDGTRKSVLREHADLTLTGLYNILEKLKTGELLTPKEDDVKARGYVLILKDLHEQIDEAVSEAYGWPADLSDEQIIDRLFTLNAERAAEERRGFIRWLRPQYQIDRVGPLAHRADKVQSITVRKRSERPFPSEPRDQAGQVLRLLRTAQKPLTPDEISRFFAEGKKVSADIKDILKSLRRLGDAQTYDGGRSYIGTAA